MQSIIRYGPSRRGVRWRALRRRGEDGQLVVRDDIRKVGRGLDPQWWTF
ncbi:hypothetical protein [Nonomuraea deserti]|nr:hypothetical protein [Nonomuraea deserti]